MQPAEVLSLQSLVKVSEIEVQASRASSLMADLKRIVPDVELAMGPLLKVGSVGKVVRAATSGALARASVKPEYGK